MLHDQLPPCEAAGFTSKGNDVNPRRQVANARLERRLSHSLCACEPHLSGQVGDADAACFFFIKV
jgi:hypothetical protein